MINKAREYKVPFLFAVIHWYVTSALQIDRLFFTYTKESPILFIVKIVYLFVLLLGWCFGYRYISKLRERDPFYIRMFQIFKVYFSITLVFLFILWPGTWSWDDMITLSRVQYYSNFDAWQHVLTGLYTDLMLQILPFPGGMIFLQNIIISLVVAYVIAKFEETFSVVRLKNKYIDIIVKIIPFILPPIIDYQLSGYRIGIYMYIELLFLVLLIDLNKSDKGWTCGHIILFVIVTVLVSNWRSESFVYLPLAVILIYIAKEKVIGKNVKRICILLMAFGFLIVNRYQSSSVGNNYQLVSTVRPAVALIKVCDDSDSNLLETVGRVLDLDVIYDNPDVDAETLYWNFNLKCDGYNDSDLHMYYGALLKLSLKYPMTLIQERYSVFCRSANLTGNSNNNVTCAARLFDEDYVNMATEDTLNKNWIANKPIFKELRKNFILILGGMNPNLGMLNGIQEFARLLIWNSLIPIIVILGCWGLLLKKKQWYLFTLISFVLIRMMIIILTEPAGVFMYLLSFYLLGYTILDVYLTNRIAFLCLAKNKYN